MVYIDPLAMTDEKRDLLLEWVANEGLDPAQIAADGKFSVHNGRVAGFKFVRNHENGNQVITRRGTALKVPFNVEQKNPLPEGLV